MAYRSISIIIPCLNEVDYIAKTLDCILGQIDHLCEIIVVDGGSVDGTWSIIQNIINVKSLKSSQASRAAQMNFGARKAKGDVLYFLHADSIPPPSFIALIREAVNAKTDLGNFSVRFNPSSRLLKINEWVTRQPVLYQGGGDQSLFIKKDVFHALNGFDERYVIMEEYDFLRRAKKQYNFKLLKEYAVTTSSRKYQNNNYLKIQWSNLYIMILYKLGVRPSALRERYQSMLK